MKPINPMDSEQLTRVMNALIAAKMAADRLDHAHPESEVHFERRCYITRIVGGLIGDVERWQNEAIEIVRENVA